MAGGDGEPTKRITALSAEEKARLEQKNGAEDEGTLEALAVKQNIYERDLDNEAKENDHDRKEKFRGNFELAMIYMMWSAVVGFLFLAAVWLANLTLPPCFRWLSEREIFGIQGILTGGLIIGLVSDHIKRRMS